MGKKKAPSKGAVVGNIQHDLKSLNSSVLVLSQKMKYVVRNEKILGRNLMVLNKKMKEFREQIQSGSLGSSQVNQEDALEAIAETLSELEESVGEMRLELAEIKEKSASAEELKELKFVIDSINPLEYVTLDQVKELIGAKTKSKKK